MRIGIMQPYFFPYIGYWQLMNAADKYVIHDDVNYIKGGWINRNRILMNGADKMISLEVRDASQNKLICDLEQMGNPVNIRKILMTIESCYKKAPMYESVYHVIEDIINNREKNLARYLEYSIKKTCDYLNIGTEILISSEMDKNNDLKGQDRVIEICVKLGADEYYNAIGGIELYSVDDFAKNNVKLSFLKTENAKYKQFKNKFTPNLSIIDVMMFNSKEEIKKMLDKYELV
ncbi:MAG: WbqC family protein [Clostridia bacterium]|jgi:hypothetical protein